MLLLILKILKILTAFDSVILSVFDTYVNAYVDADANKNISAYAYASHKHTCRVIYACAFIR